MSELKGSNLHDIRSRNRALILKLVATEKHMSRADIATRTGLTKTTIGNVVADLIAEGIIYESQLDIAENGMGRKPIYLDISKQSPCVCGMLVRRDILSVIFADFKGKILLQEDYECKHSMNGDKLVEILLGLYRKLAKSFTRKIIAIGIASLGPVDIVKQELTNPPDFYGIFDLPLPKIISQETGLPALIIHDASAGALAEKVYGMAKDLQDFIYVHMGKGIGAGFILNHQVYNGTFGKSGEIGHTSINFAGPLCHCGNVGCLEMYANIAAINAKISHLQKIYQYEALSDNDQSHSWTEILKAAEERNFLALSALDEYCTYTSRALANATTLFDINHIIVGYDSPPDETIVVKMLSEKLNDTLITTQITVEKSSFGNSAPLIGSVALITNQLFKGDWKF